MNPEEKAQLNELIAWKKAREAQQITLPLDEKSQEILAQYFMRFEEEVAFEFVGASAHVIPFYLGRQAGRVFDFSSQYIKCIVNPATNQIIIIDKNPFTQFTDGMRVSFYIDELTGGVFPGGLSGGYGDFVVANSTDNGYAFTLEDFGTSAPIDITSLGVGKLFIQKYL